MALLEEVLYSPGEPIQDMYDKINAAISAINNVLGGGSTDQIISKINATDFNTLMVNSILPASGTNNLKIKVMNIGDWNMDTNASILVAHGLSNYKNVRNVSVVIRDDSDTTYSIAPYLDPSTLLIHRLETSNIYIERIGSSFFDSVNYDATSYNRGFITIIYEG